MGRKRKTLEQHVKSKRAGKLKLYYHDEGYKDLSGNYYTKNEGTQLILEKKATIPKWKGGKKTKSTYEGDTYRGGRKSGTKNLIKLDSGNLINQHGVEFTPEQKRALESAVNRANRTRMKMLEQEGNLPRLSNGKDTGQKVSSLQVMGHESDFIIARKSKSLQGFKSMEAYERYMKNLDIVNSPTYLDDRTRLYKRNHMQALENVFGDEAKDVIMKIRMMKPEDYRKMIQQDEFLEVSYVYDPSQRTAKLNKIRMSLGMKLKEDEFEDE